MMTKRPEDRPESMTAVIALLETCKTAAAEPSAPAVESRKSSSSSKGLDDATRTRSRSAKAGRKSSTVAQRLDESGEPYGSDFSLDDLNLDVRSELSLPTLPAPSIPRAVKPRAPRHARPILPGSRPLRPISRAASLCAIGAVGLLVAAYLRFVVYSESPAADPNKRSIAMAGSKSILPNSGDNPERLEEVPSIRSTQQTVQTIFDGRTTRGWMLTDRKPLPPESLQTDGLNPHRTNSYLIVYERKFGDFVLDCDYKLSEGCNSGVFLRVGDLNDPVHTGIKVALDDPTGSGPGDSGAISGLVASSKNAQKPAGLWNHLTITAVGPVLVVSLNGTDVSRINLDEWSVPGKRPDGTDHPFQSIAIASLPRSGYLGLQNLKGDCWFKNIQMKASR